MDNKLFIIHSSEVIRVGLFHLIQSQFDIDLVLVKDSQEFKNYQSITNSRILLLIDSQLDQQSIDSTLNSLDQSNSVNTVLIGDRMDKDMCTESCHCCLSIADSKSIIYDLIESHLVVGNGEEDLKTSTSLTEREIEVVKLVANGKTNKEIADKLFISIHTVISHRKNITEKLGIKSISGLTVYAILNNLIDATSIDLE